MTAPFSPLPRARVLAFASVLFIARAALAQPQPPALGLGLDVTKQVTLDAAPAAAPGLDGRMAYVALKTGRVVAVDLESGEIRWSVELTTAWPPAAGAGTVVVAGDELLTAMHAADGRPRWALPVPGGFSAPPLLDTDWVVVGTTTGEVLAVHAREGRTLWTRSLGSPLRARPAVAADAVYLSLEDGRVVSLGLTAGDVRWERTLGGAPGDILPLDDRLFVGSRDRYFYCLKIKDGSVRWRFPSGLAIPGAPVVDERRVYFTSLDNVLRALDRGNGHMMWKRGLPLRPSGGPLLAGRRLLVAGVSAEVRAYHAHNGEPAGEFTSDSDLAAPLVQAEAPLAHMARVVLVTLAGTLLVLEERIEPEPGPFPYPLGVEWPVTVLTAFD
jgi:outer membrane protein assembly factor BamB